MVARLAQRLELFESNLAADQLALLQAGPEARGRAERVRRNVNQLIDELKEVLAELQGPPEMVRATRPASKRGRRRGVRPR